VKVNTPGVDDIEGGLAGIVDSFTVGAIDSTEVEDFVFTIAVLD
jgi:hypothetical protein